MKTELERKLRDGYDSYSLNDRGYSFNDVATIVANERKDNIEFVRPDVSHDHHIRKPGSTIFPDSRLEIPTESRLGIYNLQEEENILKWLQGERLVRSRPGISKIDNIEVSLIGKLPFGEASVVLRNPDPQKRNVKLMGPLPFRAVETTSSALRAEEMAAMGMDVRDWDGLGTYIGLGPSIADKILGPSLDFALALQGQYFNWRWLTQDRDDAMDEAFYKNKGPISSILDLMKTRIDLPRLTDALTYPFKSDTGQMNVDVARSIGALSSLTKATLDLLREPYFKDPDPAQQRLNEETVYYTHYEMGRRLTDGHLTIADFPYYDPNEQFPKYAANYQSRANRLLFGNFSENLSPDEFDTDSNYKPGKTLSAGEIENIVVGSERPDWIKDIEENKVKTQAQRMNNPTNSTTGI